MVPSTLANRFGGVRLKGMSSDPARERLREEQVDAACESLAYVVWGRKPRNANEQNRLESAVRRIMVLSGLYVKEDLDAYLDARLAERMAETKLPEMTGAEKVRTFDEWYARYKASFRDDPPSPEPDRDHRDLHWRLTEIVDSAFGPIPTAPVEVLLRILEKRAEEMRVARVAENDRPDEPEPDREAMGRELFEGFGDTAPSWNGTSEATRELYRKLAERLFAMGRESMRADHIALMRISGALVDAGDVPVEPYDEAVRMLTKQRNEAREQRDEYRRAWESACESLRADPHNAKAWQEDNVRLRERVAELERELAEAKYYAQVFNDSLDEATNVLDAIKDVVGYDESKPNRDLPAAVRAALPLTSPAPAAEAERCSASKARTTMTDESVLEWASGWVDAERPGDPTFRQRFLDGLRTEMKHRRRAALEEAAREVRYEVDQFDISEAERERVIARVMALNDSPLPPLMVPPSQAAEDAKGDR